MEAVLRAPRRDKTAGYYLVPAGALFCACPFVSTGEGLLLGLGLALACGNPWAAQTRKATQKLLPLSIVGLGAGMDLRMVARAGAHGAVYTIVSICLALTLGRL